MRYILSIVLILISISPIFAGPLQQRQMGVVKMYCAGGASCNPANDEVGAKDEDTYGINIKVNNIFCQGPYTPDCSGTLAYGNAWKYNDSTTASESVKVCVYLDDGDEAADDGDTRVACEIATSAEDASTGKWFTTTNKLGGAVSTANKYWVCLISAQTDWTNGFGSAGSFKRYTKTDSSYSTPPDTLDGLSLSDSSSRLNVHVTIE